MMDLDYDLDKLDKEQLIAKIISMQNHINQLENILKKYECQSLPLNKIKTNSDKKFDFSQYSKRHILLKFLYLGWNYDGFVVQDSADKTVEKIIFDALIKTKLIENRETCNYNRCGRTDKGVSAFCQVISLDVRSKKTNPNDPELLDNDDNEELDYVSILNKVLPRDIRAYSWAPVLPEISSRFDCTRRCYKYFFPKLDLNLELMNQSCQFLIGEHDFRNLCKMDVNNGVVNYIRKVYHCSIENISNSEDPYSICVFHIEASAFLWHQIRYIMAIIFLVGQNLESPNIITELLDIEKITSKPQYSMASDLPLVLYDAHFNPNKVPNDRWFTDDDNIQTIVEDLNVEWTEKALQCSIIKSMINSLKSMQKTTIQDNFIQVKRSICFNQTKNYKRLLDRPRCDSLEQQIRKYEQKRMKIQK